MNIIHHHRASCIMHSCVTSTATPYTIVLLPVLIFMLWFEMKYILRILTVSSLLLPSWSFVSQHRSVSVNSLRNDAPTHLLAPAAAITRDRRPPPPQRQSDISLRASSIVLLPSPPLIPAIVMSCLAATSLGYIRYEYGVSYGYGSSVAISAAWILLQSKVSYGSLAYWHALALIFYGIRLNVFLLYRELCLPRFRKFREQIEERRTTPATNGNMKTRFLSRTPFIIGCATLYTCLVAPLIITSSQAISTNVFGANISIGLTWFGFVLAALGDLQKSFIKATLGEDVLVKGALFSRLRHPNYTGEALAWTSSFAASVMVLLSNWRPSFILPAVAATFGWMGIIGVLVMATTGLEKKQFEKYHNASEYQQWIKKSWPGPTWKRN